MQETAKNNMQIFNKKRFLANALIKIATNRAANVSLALNNWKAMPLRMRWALRQKIITMSDTIKALQNERLSTCNNIFKSSL
jgi:hypothetical protein